MKKLPPQLALFLAFASNASAQIPMSLPLTPAQVTCEEKQAGRLIHRFAAGYNGSALFLWRTAAEGGAYSGLLTSNHLYFDPSTVVDIRMRDEHQLAFDLLLRSEGDFLNPSRPVLPRATLVRRDAATNLDTPPSFNGLLRFSVDLAPEVPNPGFPTNPLRISTRRDGGEAKADGAGRGLVVDDLLTPCHGLITDFDRRVFLILARTVRPTACLADPVGSPGCLSDRFKTVIYRGVEPLTYRVDVFLYSAHCNDDGTCTYGEARIPILFRLVTDAAGRWVGGHMAALPFCDTGGQLDCIEPLNPGISVYVLPPLRPGVETQGEATFLRAARLNIDFIGSEYNVLEADVNWADLLRDTAWNGGLVP